MKNLKYLFFLMLWSATAAACTDIDEPTVPSVTAPEITSVSIADGAVDVDPALGAISIYTAAPLKIAGATAITLTAADGAAVALTCTVANMNIHLSFPALARNTTYTLSVPVGALLNANDPTLTNTTARTVSFTTLYSAPDQVTITPDAALTDVSATNEAKALYAYIKDDLFLGGKIAVGSMAKFTTEMTEAEWVLSKTGRYPAIHCFDLMNLTGKEYLSDYADLEPNARAWHDAGGIVAVMWHWRDPSKATNEFYSADCTFDVSKIVEAANGDGTYTYDTESAEYAAVTADIAAVKVQLQKLSDARIPVLWRPMHEARGKWFWWGNAGADACKALWLLLREQLGDLHNLVWVWTVQVDNKFGEAQQWYPGAANVDIAGVDVYEEYHGSFAEQFKFAAEVSGSRKVVALSECGAMPDVQQMYAEGAAWAYCMPWYGDHTENIKYNGIKYWQRMMTGDFAPQVIDRSEVSF